MTTQLQLINIIVIKKEYLSQPVHVSDNLVILQFYEKIYKQRNRSTTNTVCSDVPGADKSLARPGRKQARKHFRDASDFNNIETRDVINFFLQGKAPKELHVILTETLASILPVRVKDFCRMYFTARFVFN